MTEDLLKNALRDAENLVGKISSEDYKTIKQSWENKSYSLIIFVLKKYGIEFKGLTYLQILTKELIDLKEHKN